MTKDWISSKLEVRASLIQGKGMFAKETIRKGETVIIFRGNYTNAKNAKEAKSKGKLVMQWDEDLFSVEDRGEDEGYFINHSCEPNVWMKDAFTIIAKRNIKPNEEILIDYAVFQADEDYVSKWECSCRLQNCRGKVTGKDWRLPELQEKYKNHLTPLLNKRIKKPNR